MTHDTPTGYIRMRPDKRITDAQADALKRLVANGADLEDLATILDAEYHQILADAEDRSIKARTL